MEFWRCLHWNKSWSAESGPNKGGLGVCSPRKWMNNKIVIEFCFLTMYDVKNYADLWGCYPPWPLPQWVTVTSVCIIGLLHDDFTFNITTTQHSVPEFFQFVAFLCKWELCFLNLSGIDKFKIKKNKAKMKWILVVVVKCHCENGLFSKSYSASFNDTAEQQMNYV